MDEGPLNSGYLLAGLGILGVVVGAALYVTGYHHTIGLGGIGLGAVLLIAGVWISRGSSQKTGAVTQS